MSDIHYENRQLALWAEYDDLNGRVSFEAFMERHVNVNAYIVNLMRDHGRLDREIDHAVWDDPMHPDADDYADSYSNPTGGI
jgi:hypothetical protein